MKECVFGGNVTSLRCVCIRMCMCLDLCIGNLSLRIFLLFSHHSMELKAQSGKAAKSLLDFGTKLFSSVQVYRKVSAVSPTFLGCFLLSI